MMCTIELAESAGSWRRIQRDHAAVPTKGARRVLANSLTAIE
jgi:hypothetical protein